MQSDLLQILALTTAGFLFILFRDGGRAYGTIMTFVENSWIRAAAAMEPLQALHGTSYLRLVLVGVIVLIIGWCKIVSIFGMDDVIRTVMNPSSAQLTRELDECLVTQQAVYEKLNGRVRSGTWKAAPGPLNMFESGMECPYRGHYFINKEGFLSCDRHGRNQKCPSLLQNQAGQ